ncbi:ead/Ea22-like family protein [Escherichia coli]|uniref:ead/Ea22-like family protein n=1 Tax=Escherichia coli TaxID=562 RepID=UPI001CB590C2|nr:ead/Ea22-like family protein [Escherichia coli]MDH4833232.1 ead/Ea22-like family protein [Escherichia coli]HBI7080181.1 ead/Ea22-like family protein [Escherichia coli]
MSEINYQALREAAERAIPAMERLLMLPADDDLLSEQELKDYGVDIDALNAFKFLAGPETVLELLNEIKRQEDTNIDSICRIAELEAREILLPERSSMLHRTDFHDDYQTVMAYKVSDVIAAIRAAGIRIKGE